MKILETLRRWAGEDRLVQEAAYRHNLQVLGVATFCMMALNLLHVLVFTNLSFDDPVRKAWAHQIATAHGAMVLPMFAISWFTRRAKAISFPKGTLRLLPEATAMLILAWAVVLTVMDQAISSSINAFIVASVGVSIAFLLRPHSALICLLLGWSALAWSLGLTTNNPALLTTNRMNAVSASSLALLVSILLWRRFVQAELLQRALAATNQKLEQQKTELEALATQDSLTGLLNRREFLRRAEYEMARARRQGSAISLLAMDLDEFKSINDHFGHSTGDDVLRHVAHLMTHSARQTDIIARYGGEEFVFLLPDTVESEALDMSERLRHQLSSTPTPGHGISVTASMGLVCRPGDSALGLEELLERADQAMYKAKRQGGNQIMVADITASAHQATQKH